jgi:hypothetical protein
VPAGAAAAQPGDASELAATSPPLIPTSPRRSNRLRRPRSCSFAASAPRVKSCCPFTESRPRLRRPGAPPWTRTPTSGEPGSSCPGAGKWWWSGRGLTHDDAPKGCQTARTAASAHQAAPRRPSTTGALAPARAARQGRARAAEGGTPSSGPAGLAAEESSPPASTAGYF